MRVSLFLVGRVWHYRFQVDGKRFQRSTRETSRVKAQLVADAARCGEQPAPTLSDLVEKWLVAHAATSSKAHLHCVDLFARRHVYDLGDMRIDRIRTEDVEAARARHLEGRTPGTVNLWLRILKLLFNWAVDRGLISAVPWRVRPQKLQRRPRVILPVAKAREWLEVVDRATPRRPALGTAIRLMLGLGLREGEALSARWEWIDWERELYTPGITKGREADPVPMPEWLVDHLQPARRAEGLLVPSPHGAQYVRGCTRRAIQAANAQVGTPGLTPHRLRGSFATHLSEAGVPVQDLQRIMRHKDPKTTLGYLEVDLSRASKGQEVLAERMGLWRKNGGNGLARPLG